MCMVGDPQWSAVSAMPTGTGTGTGTGAGTGTGTGAGTKPSVAADQASSSSACVDVAFEQLRLTAMTPVPVHASPNGDASVVGRLLPGALIISIAEVSTLETKKGEEPSMQSWRRIHHGVIGGGYVRSGLLKPAELSFFHDTSHAHFELVRRPREVWAEPERRPNADVTFTCTFNGRIGPFFEAIGSVLTNLGDLGAVDSWVIICDRGASVEQRAEIGRALPWATVVNKGTALHGHAISMNLLLTAFVRTPFWLQWEDDWRLPAGGDVLSRAREVCQLGVHQVAVNGAWLESDAAWGRGKFDTRDHLRRRQTLRGNAWAELLYPVEHAQRVAQATELAAQESGRGTGGATDELIEAYLAGVACASLSTPARSRWHEQPAELLLPRAQGLHPGPRPLLWPLYSNQPGLSDAAFLRSLLPFEEGAAFNPQGAYWKFEFAFGMRFVCAGGRKATLDGPAGSLARPIDCASSSKLDCFWLLLIASDCSRLLLSPSGPS